jgi:hypothetical protein
VRSAVLEVVVVVHERRKDGWTEGRKEEGQGRKDGRNNGRREGSLRVMVGACEVKRVVVMVFNIEVEGIYIDMK